MSQPISPEPYLFDLDSGRACLDFANTRGFSADHLNSYADLVSFASQANLVAPDTIAWLTAEAERLPKAALAAFEHARTLRDTVRSVFIALANGTHPEPADLDMLNAHLAASLSHARIVPAEAADSYVWGWAGADLTAPLWPIVRSAADVLTSEQERPLVRECGASDCMWLFLDSTRNRSRQWCSMTSCGNREKARRHYQRVRAKRTAAPTGADQAADAPRAPRRGRRTVAGPVAAASATAE
jgi:predicted RNA-binding Zn ribbon-like protein